MEVTEIDYEIFSLPKKEVKILDKYMFKDKQLRLKIRGKIINHKCPKCGGYHTKRYGKGYETVLVNHMFLSNYMTVQLEIEKRRFFCSDCEKNKLLESWLNSLPIEVINKISGIGSDMNAGFKNVIQNHIVKRTGKTLEEVKQIAKASVDHYHLKQLLHKLIMEVYSLSNWMIKAGHYDKNIKDLATLETKNFNKYRENKLEFNVLNFKEYKPNIEEYSPITLGYFLSKKYNTLLLMKSENLTKKQEHRLNQILCEFDPKGYLSEAYLGKELLNEAVETKDMDLIEKLISDFSNSIQYKIQTCGKTLKKWKNEIKNFFDTGITNAFTEGKNTKAKLLKRMAYGYGKKDNYIKRLLICL